ncbi:MAG: hypothetical protein ABSA78_03230 [Candidatus Sulfotelmatobacter sp.]|jgi:hypothetical protein
MKSVTGVFRTELEAQRALAQIRALGAHEDRTTVLTPGHAEAQVPSLPVVDAEQSGMGKAMGGMLGAAAGFSAGPLILAALIPGVGPITAIGLLGGAVLAAAGASIGAVAGGKLENAMTDGLPEDELFVYEDALRQGRSVLIALAEDEAEAARFRELLKGEGAESVDAAREKWWIGLRSAEQEHYSKFGRNLSEDEKFYRLGFESALHARTRCKEYDQVLSEMTVDIEELEHKYPGVEVGEPYRRGYERGRDYYQRLCDESKAA